MTDIKEENKIPSDTGEPAPTASAAQETAPAQAVSSGSTTQASAKQPEVPPMRPAMSAGEKWYNRIVYSWLNYWVNLGISVAAADWATNGSLRPKLDTWINETGKALASTKIMSLKTALNKSRVGIETLTLLTGGYLLLIPLKLAEDNKRKIVHKLNKLMNVDQRAPDGHEETPDEIYIEQEQPHQTWWNVIKRRVLGTALVVASGLAIDHIFAQKSVPKEWSYDLGKNNKFSKDQAFKKEWAHIRDDKFIEEGHLGGKAFLSQKVVDATNFLLNKSTGKSMSTGGWPSRWLELAALDTVFTKITAVTMWLTKGSKKARMEKEIGDEVDPLGIDTTNEITIRKKGEDEKSFAERVERAKADDALFLKKMRKKDGFANSVQQPNSSSPELTIGR